MNSRSESGRVTAREFAEKYGITAATVRKWVEKKKVKPVGKRDRAHLYEEDKLRLVKMAADSYDRTATGLRDEHGRFVSPHGG